jgi:hypothetical protein
MLADPILLQLVEAVAGRVSKVVKRLRRFEHDQLRPRSDLNFRRQLPAALTIPDALGFLVGEASDHDAVSITAPRYSMNRRPSWRVEWPWTMRITAGSFSMRQEHVIVFGPLISRLFNHGLSSFARLEAI